MSRLTVDLSAGVARLDHPDGSATLLISHPDWDAIVTLEEATLRRMRDGRLRPRKTARRLQREVGAGGDLREAIDDAIDADASRSGDRQ